MIYKVLKSAVLHFVAALRVQPASFSGPLQSTGHNQPSERTQSWIKVWGKVTVTVHKTLFVKGGRELSRAG